MRSIILFSLLIIISSAKGQGSLSLELINQGFGSPVGIENAGDERLFVLERAGFIRLVDASGTLINTPFLNIDSKVILTGGFSEQGLLGLAFHPDYENNGYFFVHYTDLNDNGQVSRFSVMANDPDRADPDSELKIMTIDQPAGNHNGGDLQFGADGYLYIGLGDGGGSGDAQNNSQNTNTWLGKMLRIDVNNSSEATPYVIPADNPFVNDANVLDEIWSIGLRNPWRYSFDAETGDLYIADVGQDLYAEVDFEPAGSTGGLNYGWRCYEANHTFNTSNCPDMSAFEFPIHEYAHTTGGPCSITGGFVYRGCKYADLYGKYIYADYCSGDIWMLSRDGAGGWTNVDANPTVSGGRWSSFGQGYDGTLYICNIANGNLYRIEGDEGFEISFFSGEDVIMVNTGDLPPIASFQWYFNDEPIVGATSGSLGLNQTGNYYVEVTTTTGCVITSEVMNIIPSSTTELVGVIDIDIFPNPFEENFQLQLTSDQLRSFDLQIMDVAGKVVWSGDWTVNGTAQKEIDASELTTGVYFLTIKSEAGGSMVKKLTRH